VHRCEILSQLLRFAAVLSFAALLSACSKDAGDSVEPLADGDVRFLMARDNGIEEVTLSGQDRQLFTLPENHFVLQPSISPDGKMIAFIVELPARAGPNGQLDFGADLYVANRDGSNPRPLLVHSRVGEYLEAPDWLDPDTLLVGVRGLDAAAGRSFSRILRVDAITGAQDLLRDDAAMGALSPDKKSLVYTTIDPRTRLEQLVVGDAAAQEARVIVSDTSGLALFLTSAFSPDGSQIAFAAVDVATIAPPPPPPGAGRSAPLAPAPATHPFAQDVWLVNRDGSDLRRLGEIAENMPSLTWSGDGASIYVLGPSFLWRIDPATGNPEQLRQSGQRAWLIWLAGS
jgi:Tol biopolymer transport system component